MYVVAVYEYEYEYEYAAELVILFGTCN